MKYDIWTFLIAGFPSPWRKLRRMYWRRKFTQMPQSAREYVQVLKLDPGSLIQRGLL